MSWSVCTVLSGGKTKTAAGHVGLNLSAAAAAARRLWHQSGFPLNVRDLFISALKDLPHCAPPLAAHLERREWRTRRSGVGAVQTVLNDLILS